MLHGLVISKSVTKLLSLGLDVNFKVMSVVLGY